MIYRIEIKRSAHKALLALPRDMQRRIGAAIDMLASEPRGSGTRKISSSDILYRIRVGNYRVIYEIRDDQLVIYVVKVGHRRNVYLKAR